MGICADTRRLPQGAILTRKGLRRIAMGRGILLWLLGVPIPIILLLAMCSHS